MGFEQFRKATADSIKAVSKKDRPEKLDEIQRTEEYWKARSEKLKAVVQPTELSEDRISLHWKIKSVYHGTDTAGINVLNFAEESTIGNHAVYFTIDPALAMGYAKLRGKERKTGQSHLYEATLRDTNLLNWAEQETVKKLGKEFGDYCFTAWEELGTLEYKDFSQKHGLWGHVEKRTALYALKKIIEICDHPDKLNGGNIKTISQGVMGIFFEKFVKDKGYDGVITIEGGDDQEFTAKSGISVVLFNREKILSHRAIDITPERNLRS